MQQYSQSFLQKANENLTVARLALEHQFYNAAANRAYYAAFQAAIAALSEDSIKHERNPHDWVQAQFAGVLIQRRKRYAAELSRLLMDMQNVRDIADYKITGVSKASAVKQLQHATLFVSSITTQLQP